MRAETTRVVRKHTYFATCANNPTVEDLNDMPITMLREVNVAVFARTNSTLKCRIAFYCCFLL